ncbi:MAG: phosphomannomutase/phosphoglucomutase [Candidatus Kerfeldbacteria bacterium CG08_land_8_20_14_0_20_43_14]|uniref:Phosphomannomutase/phosphoglucomutase n=1 Tax=Candidatus Kerfeldbacteria bacterium CG08_land_8_20_14_0_20_43_14 TaxID=2014246 RepID=A0A2H0YQW2_9BACT|nr:MAG: phosphomannomutase/phosphoglucomutase [Candidatus Kerfeldbacteria bacterium CG08_land_8_20_14_0_20_43_14]
MLNPKIFKSYDIRGIYPTDLNGETAFLVGQGYARLTGVKKIVVGRDMRIGSPELTKKFIEGAASQGVAVDDIGQVPIDMVYFSTGFFKYDGGLMITASHNPKEYNGVKMTVFNNGLNMISGQKIYEFIKDKKFSPADKPGSVSKKDFWQDYLNHIFSFTDIAKIKPFKIVVDAGNGMAGKVMPLIFEKLPCQLIPLNFELDGNFPAHPSNPLLPESQVQIRKKILEEKADFGIIMDGDTDRLFFVTEKGDFIRADTTLLILAKFFLERNPGAAVAYNVICSKAVPQRIKEWGGRPIRTPVGFVNVAKGIKDNNGIMGGEVSAHYSFRDNYYSDSGFIAFVILLMLISEHNKKLSEIIEGLNPYFRADETNIEVKNIPEVILAVKNKFSDGHQDELDGVTIEYKDWWLNVRPSNTEPLLRITVEGNTKEIMETKLKKVLNFIKAVAK